MQVPGAGAERKPFLFIYVSFQMFDNATDLRLVVDPYKVSILLITNDIS